MTAAIIQTRGLTKSYKGGKSKFALQNLDLAVEKGEIFGYLGPNGAGKTTTIKLLLDLIRPESGSASLFGLDARASSVEIRKRLGYLPGDLNLWKNLSGQHVIRYFSSVRGTPIPDYAKTLIEQLEFDPTKKVRSYSTGNRRKLGLILALMHRPELLVLDEPTNGLDPLVQQIFMGLMREAQANGQTVFLSSHLLNEVQAICDRAAILRDGRLLSVQRIDELSSSGFKYVKLTLRDPQPALILANVAGVEDIQVDGSQISLRLTGDFDPLLRALSGYYVVNMHVQEPTLEEIFLTYYGDRLANGSARNRQPTPEAK
ncbi:MAG: ABC transporter ATP-binding protein [Anaerolineae bacterium]|nr:ABC transporter ATP-binding protein [Anaerolineae bacterium]